MDNPAEERICHRMMHKTDIAIVGGGLNGPALALGLAQRGFSITLIDALPLPTRTMPDFDGRSYAIAHGSMRLLRGIGLWDAVKDTAQPMLEIKVTDGRAGEDDKRLAFLNLWHLHTEDEDRRLLIIMATQYPNVEVIDTMLAMAPELKSHEELVERLTHRRECAADRGSSKNDCSRPSASSGRCTMSDRFKDPVVMRTPTMMKPIETS